MKIRSKMLAGCAAFAGLLAFANVASADTINYVGVTNGVSPLTLSLTSPSAHSDSFVLAGQIVMNDTTLNKTFNMWCLDIYGGLQSSNTWSFGTLAPLTTVASIPLNPPLSSTGLSLTQISEIGGLMQWGDAHTATATYFGFNASGSAAAQLAIWSIEYAGFGFSYSGGSADLASLTTALITDVGNNTIPGDLPVFYIHDSQNSNQVLGFVGQGGALLSTPLPAALPLFASGFGVLGLLAKRRKRKVVAAIAAA
jgi:hypothetical protein